MPGATNVMSSRAIVGSFYQRLEQVFANSWASKIAMPMQSDQDSEIYKWFGMVPAMREWKNGRLAKGLRDNGLTITNKTWEQTLQLDANEIRRNKTGQIPVRVAELAQRAGAHWEKLLSALITAGDGSTYGLAYDGEYFFDTSRTEGDSGAQLNDLAAAQVAALNVGTATAPTQAEMSQAILGVIGYMLGWVDDQGEPINGDARQFLVMVPKNLWGSAVAAVANDFVRDTAGVVADNVLKNAGTFSVEVVMNPRVDWTAEFAVFRTDAPAKPFIIQEELPLQVQVLGEGSEHAFKNDTHLFGTKMCGNVGYGLWQYAAKATLS